MSALFALAAAVGWGSSDFAAGMASRRASAVSVVVLTHLTAVLVLLCFAVDTGPVWTMLGDVLRWPFDGVGRGVRWGLPGIAGSPTRGDLAWGAAAGLGGGTGAMLLFRGLGKGSMAVVAPITATGAAAIPVLFGLLTGDTISVLGVLGIALAFVAIVLVSLTDDEVAPTDDPTSAPVPRREPVAAVSGAAAWPPPASGPASVAPASASADRGPAFSVRDGELRMSLRAARRAVGALLAAVAVSSVALASGPIATMLRGDRMSGPLTAALVVALVVVGLAVFAADGLKPLFTVPAAPAARQTSIRSGSLRPSVRSMLRQPGVPEALLSGVGFGLFFVFIYRASEDAGHWPLVGARTVSVLMFASVALVRSIAVIPERGSRRPVVAAGVLDAAAAIFFVLSTRTGLLSVGAVLAALYPAVTVLLARVITKERIRRRQMIGLGLALGAVGLLAA